MTKPWRRWRAYRLSFRRPRQSAVVVWGRSRSYLAKLLIADDNITYVDPELRQINIHALLRMLLTLRVSSTSYFKAFLGLIAPKAVLSFMDNDILFYQLAQGLPTTPFIAVQNGQRSTMSVSADEPSPLNQICSMNLQGTGVELGRFGLQEYGGVLTRRAFGGTSFVMGSATNNFFPKLSANDSVQRVILVSTLPNLDQSKTAGMDSSETAFFVQGRPFTVVDLWKADAVVAKHVGEFCISNQLSLVVAGKRNASKSYERDFFDSHLPQDTNWTFNSPTHRSSNYLLVRESDLVVTIDSTFGYESLARGLRVAFLSCRMSVLGHSDIPDYMFAHGTLGDSGAFWTSSAERSEIMRVLKVVKDLSASEWYKVSKSVQEQVMAYDSANSLLRSRLASLGVDVKDVRERSYELMPEVPK